MKRILAFAALALLSLPITGQQSETQASGQGDLIGIAQTHDFFLQVGTHEVIRISSKGKVTFGLGVTPDRAAREFAVAMGKYWQNCEAPAK